MEQKEQNEKENLDKAYLDFISTISHEIRTPLTSIKGFADTMINSYDLLDDEKKKKFLNIIKSQSNRLIKMTENLLTVSKLEYNTQNLILKSFEIKPKISQVINILKAQYHVGNFSVEIENSLPKVLADEDKFEQIMLNLLENALKYSDFGSEIRITAKTSDKQNCVTISVKDNGVGIKKEDYGKIFHKFARLDNHLTRKAQGSGLGLYITKNLVELMNGKIEVTSDEAETVFTFELPIASIDKQSAKALDGTGG